MINKKIIKKDGTREDYNVQKVVTAVSKSAARVLVTLTEQDIADICSFVDRRVSALRRLRFSAQKQYVAHDLSIHILHPALHYTSLRADCARGFCS